MSWKLGTVPAVQGFMPSSAPSPMVPEATVSADGLTYYCTDCKKSAPKTQTNYTLISARHGWRLSFVKVDGRRVSVWRCPDCWTRHRAERLDK